MDFRTEILQVGVAQLRQEIKLSDIPTFLITVKTNTKPAKHFGFVVPKVILPSRQSPSFDYRVFRTDPLTFQNKINI